MSPSELVETVVFMVHALKRLSYGFHQLDQIAETAEDGSPRKAFYLDGIYSYIASFFLLDARDHPPGGSFHRALEPLGLADLLDPIRSHLNATLGASTFGDVVLTFRNKALVHARHRDTDTHRIYESVDMLDPPMRADFQGRLERLHDLCLQLALELADAADINPRDLGFNV